MAELGVLRIVVRLAAEQADPRRVLAQESDEAHQQAAAAHRKYQRSAVGQVAQDLLGNGLIAVSPERIEMGMDEVAAALAGQVGGELQEVVASAGNLDQ